MLVDGAVSDGGREDARMDSADPRATGIGSESGDDSIAWLTAAEMVNQWPDRLYEFLDVFQQVPKHRNSSTGMALRFGLLLREAARLEDLGFPTPAQALRQYLLGRYAGGHLSRKVSLFQRPEDRQLLRDRTWITQTEAATILKVRNGAIFQLIQQGFLTGHVQPAGNHGRSVGFVLRESVENLQRDLQSAVGVTTAASRLGIGTAAVRDLIHDGVLPRVVRINHGWRIPVSSLSALEAFFQGTPPNEDPSASWISLREATRIFGPTGLTLSRLLALVQAGKVTARLAHPEQRLHGLVVDQHDVESALPEVRLRQEELHGYPVHRLGKTLFPGRPVKVDVLKKWIDAGLLQSRQVGRARMVAPAEISRFRETYCFARKPFASWASPARRSGPGRTPDGFSLSTPSVSPRMPASTCIGARTSSCSAPHHAVVPPPDVEPAAQTGVWPVLTEPPDRPKVSGITGDRRGRRPAPTVLRRSRPIAVSPQSPPHHWSPHMTMPVLLASSTLAVVLVLALVREVRLRRALQGLLRRLLDKWRPLHHE